RIFGLDGMAPHDRRDQHDDWRTMVMADVADMAVVDRIAHSCHAGRYNSVGRRALVPDLALETSLIAAAGIDIRHVGNARHPGRVCDNGEYSHHVGPDVFPARGSASRLPGAGRRL